MHGRCFYRLAHPSGWSDTLREVPDPLLATCSLCAALGMIVTALRIWARPGPIWH